MRQEHRYALQILYIVQSVSIMPNQIAQTSPAYKTGYDLGKRDSMINTQDATSACRGFVSDVQCCQCANKDTTKATITLT